MRIVLAAVALVIVIAAAVMVGATMQRADTAGAAASATPR